MAIEKDDSAFWGKNCFNFISRIPGGKGGGGGRWILSTILKWVGFAQGSNPLTLFDIFHGISAPFVYLLLTNGTPFTYLVWNFAALLTAVNALLLK